MQFFACSCFADLSLPAKSNPTVDASTPSAKSRNCTKYLKTCAPPNLLWSAYCPNSPDKKKPVTCTCFPETHTFLKTNSRHAAPLPTSSNAFSNSKRVPKNLKQNWNSSNPCYLLTLRMKNKKAGI